MSGFSGLIYPTVHPVQHSQPVLQVYLDEDYNAFIMAARTKSMQRHV